ncbi:MAG: hypothetical protein LBE27_03500 [Deltaproteobacteria bacterium]|nr:hypothetical protein [Deltaproteobacteria bacterium]
MKTALFRRNVETYSLPRASAFGDRKRLPEVGVSREPFSFSVTFFFHHNP